MIESLSPAVPRSHRPVDRHPGLHVVIASIEAGDPIVRVRVDGARPPFRLYLYVDGELAEAWIPAADVQELSCAALATGGRHSVTARAIDVLGRWGAASLITGSSDRAARSPIARSAPVKP